MKRFLNVLLVSSALTAAGGCSVLETVIEPQQQSSSVGPTAEAADPIEEATKASRKERKKYQGLSGELKSWWEDAKSLVH